MILNPNHPAIWTIKQLLSRCPDRYLHVRAIYFEPADLYSGALYISGRRFAVENIFCRDIRALDFWNEWSTWLYAALVSFNQSATRPATIYVGLNLRKRPASLTRKRTDPWPYWNMALRLNFTNGFEREQRMLQVQMWKDHGLSPSFIVDYAQGILPVWCFREELASDTGAALDRSMREAASANDFANGNSYEECDLIPLPGFMFHLPLTDYPPQVAGVVDPSDYLSMEAPLVDPKELAYFPPATRKDILRFYSIANEMPGSVTDNLKAVLKNSAEAMRAQGAISLSDVVSAYQKDCVRRLVLRRGKMRRALGQWSIDRPRVPHLTDYTWPRNYNWAREYCAAGFERTTDNRLDVIGRKLHIVRPNKKTLDGLIIYELVKAGYTLDAVLEFISRPSVRFLSGMTKVEIGDLYFEAVESTKAALAQFYDLNSAVKKTKEYDDSVREHKKEKNKLIKGIDSADKKS